MRLCLLVLAVCSLSCSARPEKTYPMHGKVVSVDDQSHLAKIDAGKIGDWMSAMTMDYPVPADADWQKMKVGTVIDATVHVQDDKFWVAGVNIAK